MPAPLRELVAAEGLLPRGEALGWKPGLIFLHLASDTLIGLSFLAISLALYSLVRRTRVPFSATIVAFGIFIAACSATHFIEVVTLWHPAYWLLGAVKAATALASVATALLLVPVRPQVIELASSARLAEERRLELERKTGELEALASRLHQAVESKTRFFASVSHELRTPLSLILGPADKLARTRGLAWGQREEARLISRNARLLLHHVNDLLDVARLDAGRMPVAWADVDLARLLRFAASHFAALASDRRVQFAVEAPESVPAQADPDQLLRVLLNLLANAFKFTPEGGRVRCALAVGGERAQVRIEDSGPGVPAQEREAIFERFRQSDSEAARHRGSGLGLAIARELTELHGGRISVGEAKGGGASFSIDIPLRAPPGTAVGKARAALARVETNADELLPEVPLHGPVLGSDSEERPRVLVCEDNPEMRSFIAVTLADEFEVELARDGDDGLSRATAHPPDLLVSDMMMPGISGEELLRRLQSSPGTAAVPVMLLTARADDETRVRLLRAGAHDYLTKPFLADELRARARNLVSTKRAREVLGEELKTSKGELSVLARELARRKRELQSAVDSAGVAREQAERASESKSTFLSLVSHELRTPLSSLQLAAHTLRLEAEKLSRRQGNALDRIDRSTRRLLDLVGSMLEYTRAESGRLATRLSTVDVRALFEDLADELRGQAQAKGLSLRVEAEGALPPVLTDQRLLRLSLLHLVANAIKHTGSGAVTLVARHEGAEHHLEVHDTGPGIPAELAERIFEPFEVAAPLERKHEPGLGLGLPLVRSIVEALGGHIELRRTSGEGSVFRIRLAAARAHLGGRGQQDRPRA